MTLLLLVLGAFLVTTIGAILTALADTRAAEAAAERQDRQIVAALGGSPPVRIVPRPSDARRTFEPGDPAVEPWYEEYERQFGPNPPYPPGARQNPVPIPYTV